MASSDDKTARDPSIDRRNFLEIGALAGVTVLLPTSANADDADKEKALFPALAKSDANFRAIVIADPQVGPADAKGLIPATTQQKLSQIVEEVNLMQPLPAFVLVNGDLVESPNQPAIDNFLTRIKALRVPVILVHGNHDGRPPYTEFREMQKQVNGTSEVMFSFDCGKWHFLTFPCNFAPGDIDYPKKVLEFVERDLTMNKDKSTIIFEHLHLMPVGLTQLEWYTYEKPWRTALVEILGKAGNVKYVICGHVHNGIQTSSKTGWSYQGVQYIVAPTCTASRNFGEEFPQYQQGMPQGLKDSGGGYYMILQFKDEKVSVRAKLVGVKEEYNYPPRFREFLGQDPYWFKPLSKFVPSPSLVNGDFEAANGLEKWIVPYRYWTDKARGFIADTKSDPTSKKSQVAYLYVREKGEPWANVEMHEIDQLVHVPAGGNSLLRAMIYMEGPTVGGGAYARVCLFRGDDLACIFLIDWGDGNRSTNHRMAQNTYFKATGKMRQPWALVDAGQKKEALFFSFDVVPQTWHTLMLNLPVLYNSAVGTGSYEKLAIDKALISFGVWCHKESGSTASLMVDDVTFLPGPVSTLSTFDDKQIKVDDSVFTTDFGLEALKKKQRDRQPA